MSKNTSSALIEWEILEGSRIQMENYGIIAVEVVCELIMELINNGIDRLDRDNGH